MDFLKDKRFYAVALALVALGYGLALFTRPAKVEVKEKITYQDKIVYQDRVVEKTVYVEAKKTTKQKTTKIVKTPDGTKTTEIVENTKTDTDKSTKTDTDATKTVYVDREVVKEVTKTVTNHDNWRVGVNFGLPLGNALVGDNGNNLYYGLAIDRRVVGPLWVGAYGTTDGDYTILGIGVSGTF